MTVRSRIMVRLARFLDEWLDTQPEPRGTVLFGKVGVVFLKELGTVAGVDVAYIPPAFAADPSGATTLIEGLPILVVEILSPSDTQADIEKKVETYLAAKVAHIWVVNPHFRTVQVYRLGYAPVLLNATQEIAAKPDMPGFKIRIEDVFA